MTLFTSVYLQVPVIMNQSCELWKYWMTGWEHHAFITKYKLCTLYAELFVKDIILFFQNVSKVLFLSMLLPTPSYAKATLRSWLTAWSAGKTFNLKKWKFEVVTNMKIKYINCYFYLIGNSEMPSFIEHHLKVNYTEWIDVFFYHS